MAKEYQDFGTQALSQAEELGLNSRSKCIGSNRAARNPEAGRKTSSGRGLSESTPKADALQADPSCYAMKQKFNNYDTIVRRVLYKDLRIQSPYNTYRNRGLPPGPIWMPDLGA